MRDSSVIKKEKVLIIGAGLSGLHSAFLLQESCEVILVEARNRVGGRIHQVEGHDMGPSWVWAHQKNILRLIKLLELEIFEQYTEGLALYDAPEGVEKFTAPPSSTSYRIKGGISAMIVALEARLMTHVKLDEPVVSLVERDNKIEVHTTKSVYLVDRVISTLPPRLAVSSITYEPALPHATEIRMQNTPTWMGYASKCVITYSEPFWREKGLSGFTFSHLGPLGEIHDASNIETAALFGFVHSQAKYENIEEDIVKQLTRLYGPIASKPDNIYMIDWKKEHYTSSTLDAQPLQSHPMYGLEENHFGNKMIFSGTECALSEGGYLEGALIASSFAVKSVLT